MLELRPDEAVAFFANLVGELMARLIPNKTKPPSKSFHPWLTQRAVDAVKKKHAAQGKENEGKEASTCSAVLQEEYLAYVRRSRAELLEMNRGSKLWWSRSKRLLCAKVQASSVPALKVNGSWILDAVEKANAFADSFGSKWHLPPADDNEYSPAETMGATVKSLPESEPMGAPVISLFESEPMGGTERRNSPRTDADVDAVCTALGNLDEDSATSPDLLPTRVLKQCAVELALPIALTVKSIVKHSKWPSQCKIHGIHPLHKKKSVYERGNYKRNSFNVPDFKSGGACALSHVCAAPD